MAGHQLIIIIHLQKMNDELNFCVSFVYRIGTPVHLALELNITIEH